ncbi:Kinesin-like protein [Entamoeba marina]
MKATDQIIQVGVRVRPVQNNEVKDQCFTISGDSIQTLESRESITYDFVGGESVSQKEMFERVGIPFVQTCLEGLNATIFAYGQTGSGKTYTVFGNYNSKKREIRDAGLIPRCLEYLYTKIANNTTVTVSMYELYGDSVFDLLSPNAKCEVKQDRNGKVIVDGLTEYVCAQWRDALTHTIDGNCRRKVSTTQMNATSSRSHCVTQIKTPTGSLVFVDLAGSERISKSQVVGVGFKEAAKINNSLVTLGRVIRALVKKEDYVPFRDSKLTHMLKESLIASERICIIATVSGSLSNSVETWGTLKFAQNAKLMRNRIKHVKEVTVEDIKKENELLKEEVQSLKRTVNPEISKFDYEKLKRDALAWKELYKNNPSVASLQSENDILKERLKEASLVINNLQDTVESLTSQNFNLREDLVRFKSMLKEKVEEVNEIETVARAVQHRFSEIYKDNDRD